MLLDREYAEEELENPCRSWNLSPESGRSLKRSMKRSKRDGGPHKGLGKCGHVAFEKAHGRSSWFVGRFQSPEALNPWNPSRPRSPRRRGLGSSQEPLAFEVL